ncbi:MAG TPA: hypothetical protein VI564_07345 [Candidatus Nanoarchaeia archaeon]|nr:hypothetical protein [Candidatus Nanoarchaeia archaeon]
MNSKNISLIMVICIFISSCSSSNNQQSSLAQPIYGFDGLKIEFAKGLSPKVFEKSSFPLILKISNQGTYTINENDKAVLSIGTEKDYIPSFEFLPSDARIETSINPNQRMFALEGRSPFNPRGEEIYVGLNAKTSKLDAQSEKRVSTLTASLCYRYKTVLNTDACIDTDIVGIRTGKKVCTVKDIVFPNGQGAPIAVTKIEQQIIPQQDSVKQQFLIYVENKGNGHPLNPSNYLSICDSQDFSPKLWNVAFLKAFRVGGGPEGEQMICCPNINGECIETETDPEKMAGFIRLKDNKDFVRCTFAKGVGFDKDTFISPIKIEIEYGYSQTISTDVVIQRPIKY